MHFIIYFNICVEQIIVINFSIYNFMIDIQKYEYNMNINLRTKKDKHNKLNNKKNNHS